VKVRAGLGYDIHKLEEGRKLFLGGVEVDFPKGLRGHSDGDCLIHAVIDALLGASGEGDIGRLFPDVDPQYKGMRSTEMLRRVMARIREKNMEILNIDSVIVAEKPLLAAYIPQMKKVLCPILDVGEHDLGIKAKTNEGLGAVGREEAIACWAQALVRKKD